MSALLLRRIIAEECRCPQGHNLYSAKWPATPGRACHAHRSCRELAALTTWSVRMHDLNRHLEICVASLMTKCTLQYILRVKWRKNKAGNKRKESTLWVLPHIRASHFSTVLSLPIDVTKWILKKTIGGAGLGAETTSPHLAVKNTIQGGVCQDDPSWVQERI